MEVHVASSPEEFLTHALDAVRASIAGSSKSITIGLSGGSTPVPLYEALSRDDSLPWDQLRFFLVDERYVPSDSAESNASLARSTILKNRSNAFITPDTSKPIDICIRNYDDQLQTITPDLVILGMGEDGHIASLFPPLPPEAFGPANVIHTKTDQFAAYDRISTTLPFLERAKHRLFLISGKKKIDLFRRNEHENLDPSMFPAHALFDERTTWILG